MDASEFREVGHRWIDRIADLFEAVEEQPVFPKIDPRALHEIFEEPLPEGPTALDTLADDLERRLLPYCTHVNHPGYFGLITPSPLPAGVLGDLLASALNQNVGAWSIGPSAVALERRVVRWLTDLIGWTDTAGGNLTSGGMMANFIGLKLARDWATNDRAQHEGITGPLAAYTSEERHVSVDKAADAIGIGRQGLRVIPTSDEFEIRLDELEVAIEADRRRGTLPFCIIAMGGSTNTGSIDPLARLREIADRERMWLHVDAAYGGGMLLSRRSAGALEGIALADSVTIDPHKWFYAPLDAGAILVRDETRLTRSFGLRPAYLSDPADKANDRYDYFVHGFEQSRRFRGLKVWLGLKRHGARAIGDWIDANVEQAQRLWELAREHADFEPAVRPRMSAVCVKYAPRGVPLGEAQLGELHARVARRVEQSGRFWISTTVLKGTTWFRINPVNFRTRLRHVEELFAMLTELCPHVAGELGAT